MATSSDCEVLIIGAGTTGLAAALFLAERGVRARLIDSAAAPNSISRAQVLNPRSLELLEASGVTALALAEARIVHGVRFHEAWQPLADIDFIGIPSHHPMAVLPQARTAALLAQALKPHAIEVEHGITLQHLTPDQDNVRAVLRHPDGAGETTSAALVLAADGANSIARKALGLTFDGSSFPEPWPLYDIELNDPLDPDHAHVCLVTGGLIFLLCLRPGLWRVFGDVLDPLNYLPAGARTGRIEWQSIFHIAHRLASPHASHRVALAGDAAHIHAPIGARGMNLGIEDAFVFAACAADELHGHSGRIEDYARLRHPVHRSVVGRMERLTFLARGRPGWVGVARHYILPGLAGFSPVAERMRRFVTGTDHPIETTISAPRA